MTDALAYRPMTADDAPAVSRLILEVFEAFIVTEYSEEGRAEFGRYVEPDALMRRLASNHFLLVAVSGDRLAGVIEMRDNDHVSLLFVDQTFQRHGVARTLLAKALAVVRPARPDLERVTVNSSRYGVPVYEKLGFRQTGPERSVNGIVFISMAHQLSR